MISCRFIGKLGNHMYQTAATIKVAEQLGVDFVLPTKSHAGHYGDISPDFSGFAYPFKFEDRTYSNKIDQKVFHYVPIEAKDDTEYHGFYQCHEYFDSIRDKLINKYYKFNDKVIEDAKRYEATPQSLGISVRRGDYLHLQHNHCVLSMKYYEESLMKIVPDLDALFVFSDDIPWCKENFVGKGIQFVEGNPFTQLYLMTQMKHLVLSNSTFAWWGGYLNDKGGVVVVPDPWFGPANDHLDTKGLYCPNWYRQKHNRIIV